MRNIATYAVAALALTLFVRPAFADETSAEKARAEFVEGTKLVEDARWAEALAAFERARDLQPHAVTTFNIGACERAMGRYTRAKRTFEHALEENKASGDQQLSKSLVTETQGYIGEIDGLLAHVDVTLVPETAAIAVDGRPLLEVAGAEGTKTMLAGVRDPAPGEEAPAKTFTVLLDPGAHVFVMSREGFSDAIVTKTVAAGATLPLTLELDLLPATLRIESNRAGAIVTVNRRDVGPVPVDVARPAGSYHVTVHEDGFQNYETDVVVKPGEELHLRAALKPREPLIVERWWFWTAAGVVVTGAIVGTYFATAPAPSRPAVDGGTLGWKVAF